MNVDGYEHELHPDRLDRPHQRRTGLGTVVELSSDTIFVGGEDQRRSITKSLVDEEDEEARLAILSVDAQTIEEGSYSR